MARILLATHGSRGDIQPVLALALGLQAAGHQVRLSGPPDFSAWVAGYGIEYRPVGSSIQELIATRGPELMRNPLTVLHEMRQLMQDNLTRQFSATLPLAEGCDLVLGASLQLSAFSAAEYWQIPYRYLVFCPSLLPSRAHMPLFSPWPVLHPLIHQPVWHLLGLAWQASLGRVLNRERHTCGLPPVADVVTRFLTPQPLLAAYRELAPAPPDCHVAQVPALHLPLSDSELPPAVEAFLEAGPPPVYFGFGSMNDGRAEASTDTLLQLAEQRGTRLILSSGWGGLSGTVRVPENVLLVDDVAHGLLFPRLRAVVHHGGAGTTQAAARAGIPQLIIPHLLDQYYWARAVSDRQLGPPGFVKRHFKLSSLQAAVQALTREPYQLSARALGARLSRQQGVHEAVNWLEQQVPKT
jgi:vancomycin aglycone glucosyltransferase